MGREISGSPGGFDGDGHGSAATTTGELFATFGEFLRYLRRRERLTQTDLGISVGYSTQHINLLESGRRLPDPTTVAALFVPALHLDYKPDVATRLVELAATACAQAASGGRGRTTHGVALQREVTRIETTEEVGRLEDPPPAPPLVVERPLALARLRESLANQRCLALCGLPGMGKTTLAATLAREYARTSPVFWVTFSEGVNTSADALVRQLALFAIAYSLAPADQASQLVASGPDSQPLPLDQQIMLLSSALGGPASASALLCFDNAHLILAEAAVTRLLARLIATSPASFLLISREDVSLPGLAHVELDGLEPREAGDLVQQLLGSAGPVVEAGTPSLRDAGLLDRLYERTAGSPILLRLSVGQMVDRHLDAAIFIEQLATQPQIDSYLLDTIISRLSPSARTIASLVSIFREPVNLYDPALVKLMRERRILDPHRAGDDLAAALSELQHRHVLDNPGKAALHPLLADFLASTLAADPAKLREAHLLAARYSEQALADNIEAAYHCCRAGRLEETADLLADQGVSVFNQGKGQSALEVLDEALAQVRRKRSPPAALLRRLLTVRGDLLASSLRAGEAEANYREALALALNEGNAPTVCAQTMARLASCLTQRSQAPEALELCRQALTMLDPGDKLLTAQLTAVESGALAVLGRLDEAETSGLRALELSRGLLTTLPSVTLGIRARVQNVLGMVSAIRQRHDDALVHWSSAIDAARQTNQVQLEYRCRGNMGNVFFEKGDLERATQYCAEAISVLQSIGDDYGAVRFMNTLGNAHYLSYRLDDAVQTLERAAEIKQRMGDHAGTAISLATQGLAMLAQGLTSRARLRIEDGLREVEGAEATRTQGYILMMLCDTQLAAADVDGALATLDRAEELPGAEADLKWSGDLQNHRSLALLAAGDLEAARKVASDPLPQAAGIEIAIMRTLINGSIALAEGDREQATHLFDRAGTQAHEAGYKLYERIAARLQNAAQTHLAPIALVQAFYSA